MKRRPFLTGPQYEIVAGIVRTLPETIRQEAANHFATEFHKRSPSFDPYAWEKRTGGRVQQ